MEDSRGGGEGGNSSLEEQLALAADVWRPLLEEALEHALRVVDCLPVDRKDKAGRAARRERGDRIDEVLDELEAIKEAHYEIHAGVGKLLPEEDIPELARLIRAVRSVSIGVGESTAADADAATELGELVSESMLKRGGPAAPQIGGSGAPAPAPAVLRDPLAEDRQRTIERLEQQKVEAVAAERYEEAGELKAQIAEQKLLLVERRREMEDESEQAEVNKRYSGQKIVEIFKYRWDQTDQYVRVYVDIPCGVDRSTPEAVLCEFPPDPEHPEDKGKHQSFTLRALGLDGRLYCLKRKVLRPIDPHEFGEINSSTIRGVSYGGCRAIVEDKRVIVHMTKYFMIVTDEERAEYREMAEQGMMGPMGGMMGSREDEDRTSAGMWETLELPAYARQPKKVYHRDEDTGTPSSASAEPEPEPEPESGARESSDEILPKGTAVIVSGLLDPSGGDGDATKLLVRPECLLEDLDAAVEAEGGGAEEQLQSKGAGAAVAAEPTPPPPVGSQGVGSDGSVGHRYRADYDRFERLAAQQNDIDEDLMEIMHKMYANGDTAKKKELEASYRKAKKKMGAHGPY